MVDVVMFGVHPDLRRHVLITSVSSAALGVAGFVALIIAWRSPSGPPLPLLLFGGVALSVAYVGLVIAPRWYRRASRFVTSTKPTTGQIVLHLEADSDSTSLYASLATDSTMVTTQSDRFLVIMPRWPVKPILDTPIEAKIFRNPRTQRPVAFEVAGGFLRCFPHGRALWRCLRLFHCRPRTRQTFQGTGLWNPLQHLQLTLRGPLWSRCRSFQQMCAGSR